MMNATIYISTKNHVRSYLVPKNANKSTGENNLQIRSPHKVLLCKNKSKEIDVMCAGQHMASSWVYYLMGGFYYNYFHACMLLLYSGSFIFLHTWWDLQYLHKLMHSCMLVWCTAALVAT